MGAPEWLAEGGGSGSAAAQPGGTPFHIPPRELLVLAIVAAALTVCLVCGCCACWLRRRRQRGRAATAQPAGLAEPLNPHLQRPGEDHDRDMKDLMFVLLGEPQDHAQLRALVAAFAKKPTLQAARFSTSGTPAVRRGATWSTPTPRSRPNPSSGAPSSSSSRISVMPDLLAQVEEIMDGRPLFKQEEILF